jgi:hypothetical protein
MLNFGAFNGNKIYFDLSTINIYGSKASAYLGKGTTLTSP